MMSLYSLDLTGWTTMFCTVDYAFSLNFTNIDSGKKSDRLSVRIEGPFTFRDASGEYSLNPSEAPTELGPALQTCRTAPTRFVVEENGTLTISFERDISIIVPPLDRYEAWTSNGPGESVLVCTPGGHVAVFDRVEGTPLKLSSGQWPPAVKD